VTSSGEMPRQRVRSLPKVLVTLRLAPLGEHTFSSDRECLLELGARLPLETAQAGAVLYSAQSPTIRVPGSGENLNSPSHGRCCCEQSTVSTNNMVEARALPGRDGNLVGDS
jgi:hypothetical protein